MLPAWFWFATMVGGIGSISITVAILVPLKMREIDRDARTQPQR